MTLKEALILSYVKRGIGYGYNILQHVRESGSDEWVDFSRAGLYKTLEKLERDGLLTMRSEQRGGRPPRKTYTITEKGDAALAAFLEREFDFAFQQKYDFDAYLVTAVAASPDSRGLAKTVEKRLDAVRNHLTVLKDEWPEDKDAYPLIVYALYKRRLSALETEREWLEWFLGILDNVSGDVLHTTWGQARI